MDIKTLDSTVKQLVSRFDGIEKRRSDALSGYVVEYRDQGKARKFKSSDRHRAEDFFNSCKTDPNVDWAELAFAGGNVIKEYEA